MKKTIVVISVVIVAICGCNPRRTTDTLTLDESVKTDAGSVVLDTIRIAEEFFFAKRMYVYKNNYLVVENLPNNKAVPFVEIYDIQNQRRVKGFIHNGNGPNEMLMIDTHLTGNIFMVRDFAKQQYAVIDLDAALADNDYRPEVKTMNTNMGAPQIAMMDSARVVLENPLYFEDDGLGIHHGEKRLLIFSSSTLSKKVEFKFFPHIVSGVSQGKIAVNYSKNRIIYASLNFPVVEVYDGELNKIKMVNGPDVLPRSFAVGQAGSLAFKGGTPMSYLSFCCNDDYIWLSYIGTFYERGTIDRLLYKTPSYIFKFDWDGNFISSLSVGAFVSPISLGSDGETLYAMTYDHEGLPVPVKLVVK